VSDPLILGIESTCDETGVALVRGRELLADVTATSMDQYARFGGIIPEIASRAHLESFLPTLDAALEKAGVDLSEVDAVAVCAGPGLIGSLTVGISAAKALAASLNRPIYGVNHVIGHLAVDELVDGPLPERFVGLIVSGGHSNLLSIRNVATDVVELGGTLDDAAGEAFDKVGRLLGLPYPGGPHVDRLSQEGDRGAIRFPRGLAAGKDKERHRYDFSFSGLKTAVARYVESLEDSDQEVPSADVCAAFSEAVNDSLTAKAVQACLDTGCDTLVVGGGYSANSRLRSLAAERCEEAGITLRLPPLRFCTDNGAQIAALGSAAVRAGVVPSPMDFAPDSGMPLDVSVAHCRLADYARAAQEQSKALGWRRLVQRQLLEVIDLRRSNLTQFSADEVKAEVRSAVERIVAGMQNLPPDIDRDMLVQDSVDEAVGLGPLERLMTDPLISEIMVNSATDIFVERKGKLQQVPLAFSDDDAIRNVIERIVAPLGRRIDESSPLVDARLPDGSRVNAIIPPVALKGPTITIRRFNRTVMTPDTLVANQSASPAMMEFLRICVEQHKSIIVSGGTGSGKSANGYPKSRRS